MEHNVNMLVRYVRVLNLCLPCFFVLVAHHLTQMHTDVFCDRVQATGGGGGGGSVHGVLVIGWQVCMLSFSVLVVDDDWLGVPLFHVTVCCAFVRR
mgnify:CR=1 FL=1